MKKKVLVLLPLIVAAACLALLLPKSAHAAGDIDINSINFPDANFRKYVTEHFDKNKNGYISYDEFYFSSTIFLSLEDDGPIGTLKGIELFQSEFEVYLSGYDPTLFDFSEAENMTKLIVRDLTAENVVINAPYIKQLFFFNSNIKNVNVNKCEDLKELHCRAIHLQKLTADLPYLWVLECDENSLTSLDASKCTNLRTLKCQNNKLKSLNAGNCNEMKELHCYNNQLTSLKLPTGKLELLDCSNNKLTGIEIKKLKKLEYLFCSNNQLTELDNSNNTNLVSISCANNKLTALYINTNTKLFDLDCSNNQLPGLDPSKNGNLLYLYIEGNPGKKYNISETRLGEWLRDGLGTEAVVGGNGKYYDVATPGFVGFWEWELDDPGDPGDEGVGWYALTASFDEDDVVVALDTPEIKASNTGSGVRTSWNKVKSAAEYEVWRAPKGSTNYKLLKTVAGTSYTDKTAVAGNSYAYRICAKNGIVYSKNAAASITRNPFTDVSESASYFGAVMWAVNNGITSGTSSTTFSPNADCTRYQFAVMLYKLAGKPAVSGTLPFKDVKKTDSYYNAVLWAYTNGIISGTSKTTFSPKAGITRYQVVQMLYKFVGKPPVSGTLPFKDVSTKASYYNAVLWAVQNGITKGTDSTHFSPNAVCKRYQLVVFLYKFNNIYHIK